MSDQLGSSAGQRLGAAGEASYVFDGGADLIAGASESNVPETARLRWVRQSDGAVVAEIYAWDFEPASGPGAQRRIELALDTPDADPLFGPSKFSLRRTDGAENADINALSSVRISTPHSTVVPLDEFGQSSFIKAFPFGSWRAHGPYGVDFSIPGGGTASADIATDLQGTAMVPFGGITGALGSPFLERVTWSYVRLSATRLRLNFALPAEVAGPANGTLWFFILSID